MTNQTRDFDQSDGRVLAEFADLEITEIYDDVVYVDTPFDGEQMDKPFMPWHEKMEQWQIQSLKDAVREKGLIKEFWGSLVNYLDHELGEWPNPGKSDSSDEEQAHEIMKDFTLIQAPPEAICSAIIELEGEHQ